MGERTEKQLSHFCARNIAEEYKRLFQAVEMNETASMRIEEILSLALVNQNLDKLIQEADEELGKSLNYSEEYWQQQRSDLMERLNVIDAQYSF